MITGVLFLILKGYEYSEKFARGISFGNDTFFTMYVALTGFHFIHGLVAVVLLFFMGAASGAVGSMRLTTRM